VIEGKLAKVVKDVNLAEEQPQALTSEMCTSALSGLIAVVGLRGGSKVTRGLSARGLGNVAVQDWSDVFTFVIGGHRYECQPSVAEFLSPRVAELHSFDPTMSELILEVEDGDALFGSVLEAAKGGSIAVDSAHQRTFVAICDAIWNSELCESVSGQLCDRVTMENAVDRLRFLSATRCDISAELEFIASHFGDFLRRPDALKALPFPTIYEIIGHRSLRLDSEDSLYDFIRTCTETALDMFSLLKFVRFECCSTDVMNDLFDVHSEHFCEITAPMWAGIRARLLLPNKAWKQFPPVVKKGRQFDVPDGIIAHLTRECGGNVHDCSVVAVTSGSFEKEICGANPHSGTFKDDPRYAAKNAADLETCSCFESAYRSSSEDILHTVNNWVCYDFMERNIVPTHYTIRASRLGPGYSNLKL
jgi:hypothetical protein